MSAKATLDLDSYAAELDSEFERVRSALRDEQEARENTIRSRYEWGKRVQKSLSEASRGDSLAEKVADNIDKTPQYVWNHAKFYRAVKEEWPDDGIDGYLQDCEDFDRNLTWTNARSWAEDSSEEEVDTTEQEVHEQTKRTERALERAEEEYSRLQEMAMRTKGELPDSQLEEVTGTLVATGQAIQDSDPEDLPDPEPERTENREYLDWVKKHDCCVCGQSRGEMDPHHLDAVGIATKGTDFLTVPLCRMCHNRLDSVGMDEVSFFRKEGVNPYEVSAELMARLLNRLNNLESVIDRLNG